MPEERRSTRFDSREPVRRATYAEGLLEKIAGGKYAGCRLAWLADADLVDCFSLSINNHFRHECRRLLVARGLARPERVFRERAAEG